MGCGFFLLYGFALGLIGVGLSLRDQRVTSLGLAFAGLALLATAWRMRNMLRLPDPNEGWAELMSFGDPFQSVGLALAQTAPFGETRLVMNLDTRAGNLQANLDGSQGALPVPQVVLAGIRDLAVHLEQQGKQIVPMRWTLSREEDGEWSVNLTFL